MVTARSGFTSMISGLSIAAVLAIGVSSPLTARGEETLTSPEEPLAESAGPAAGPQSPPRAAESGGGPGGGPRPPARGRRGPRGTGAAPRLLQRGQPRREDGLARSDRRSEPSMGATGRRAAGW